MNKRYTTDVKYPTTYFHFQTPVIMSSVALLTGHKHRFPGSEFSYCDFGCGQGYMLCLLAACNPDANFYGVDLNSAHIESAQRLADEFDLKNVTLINADFDDLTADVLPELDFAAITGVYSWLPTQTRTRLIETVSNRLKDGGLCFLHYLAMPGFTRSLPTTALTQLMAEHQEGDSAARAVAAVSELHGILDGNPQLPFNKRAPDARMSLKQQLQKDTGDIAHDLLNRNLQPMWFHTVAKEMRQNDMAYISHARPHMNAISNLYVNEAASAFNEFCKKYDDPILREEMMALLLDLPVRMDIFGKNVSDAGVLEADNFSKLRIHSMTGPHHEAVRRELNRLFYIDLFEPVYTDILEGLSGQSEDAPDLFEARAHKHGEDNTRRALLHLFGANLITFGAQSNAQTKGERQLNPDNFGRHILYSQLADPGEAPVPSRLLASCIKLPQLERMLLAVLTGLDPEEIWAMIVRKNVKLRAPNNQPITDYTTFNGVLSGTMPNFKTGRLPELLKLGLLSS